MKTMGIIAKRDNRLAIDVSREVISWLKTREINTVLDGDLGRSLNLPCHSRDEIASMADIMLVLGGDGTLLFTAGLVSHRCIPILGVNLGSLGFLTEITIEELYPALEKVINGEFEIEERVMLSVSVFREGVGGLKYHVLNDAVVNKGSVARIIELDVMIDDLKVTTYKADGLIVSTPTGSTAYSLSAGGPIMHPTLNAIALTPICPHTLTNRPVVISDTSTVTILIQSKEEILLTLDGVVGQKLNLGDRVIIRKSDIVTHLIKSPYRNYYEVLRKKLKWGER